MKKLAVIGRGTAGALGILHFIRYTDWAIDWYYDDKISTQAVGEGTNISVPQTLYTGIGFDHFDLEKIDGTIKRGIFKSDWGQLNAEFYGGKFPPPFVGYHINAVKMQDYILSKVKENPRVNVKIQNIGHEDIDADFIYDCSGKPKNYDDFNTDLGIPVNSVYVTQCYWDYERFNYTLTLARPHGWVFGIPLKNRCSIGYLYNKNISTIDEVKEDVKNVFKKYNLEPSEDTNSFSFNNYYRKKNWEGRVGYSGNSSFFLEPLEATTFMQNAQVEMASRKLWFKQITEEQANKDYQSQIKEIDSMIMMHYYAGSTFDTDFWKFAKERSLEPFARLKSDPRFNNLILRRIKSDPNFDIDAITVYGGIHTVIWKQLIDGLGLNQEFFGGK